MLYAAYGSNLHPMRLQRRTPTAQIVGTAAVRNMSLHFHKRGYRDGSGKCNIVFCDADSTIGNTTEKDAQVVHLAIYSLSEHELPLLDQYEGAGFGYERTSICIRGFGDCAIYLANNAAVNESLLPFSWYKELVIIGCEHFSFPDSYVDKVRTIEAVEDTNQKRHNLHMKIAREAKEYTSSCLLSAAGDDGRS